MKHTPFPYLNEHQYFEFPPVSTSTPEGIVATGGNLSPGMLISAYSQGIFPWYSEYEPILWWSPDPRFVLFFENLHISKSMRKLMQKDRFTLSFDTAFHEVICACSKVPRPGQEGTWITGDMVEAYTRMHEMGYAHSLEVWDGDELGGGLYGISMGRCFFGESMFTKISNCSKVALIYLTKTLDAADFYFIDSQVANPHMAGLGAVDIPREQYLRLLDKGLKYPTLNGRWTNLFPKRKTSEILKL